MWVCRVRIKENFKIRVKKKKKTRVRRLWTGYGQMDIKNNNKFAKYKLINTHMRCPIIWNSVFVIAAHTVYGIPTTNIHLLIYDAIVMNVNNTNDTENKIIESVIHMHNILRCGVFGLVTHEKKNKKMNVKFTRSIKIREARHRDHEAKICRTDNKLTNFNRNKKCVLMCA